MAPKKVKPASKIQAEVETRARVQIGERVKDLVQHRGDPRLNAWEEGFLVGMADLLRKRHGHPRISAKQAAVVLSIEDKLRLPAPPEDPEEEESTC